MLRKRKKIQTELQKLGSLLVHVVYGLRTNLYPELAAKEEETNLPDSVINKFQKYFSPENFSKEVQESCLKCVKILKNTIVLFLSSEDDYSTDSNLSSDDRESSDEISGIN